MKQVDKKIQPLNSAQKRAVGFGKGPLSIIAGAGTGKTTVITRRILNLVEKKQVKIEEILVLTFTEKAAQEIEERIDNILQISSFNAWISTFHSFCDRILKERGLDIGISTDYKLLDEIQAWLLVRQNLDKFNLKYYQPLGNPTKFIRILINHFSRCKDEGVSPDDYLKYGDDLMLNMDGIAIGSKAIKGKDKKELAEEQQEADRIKEVANAYFVYQKLLIDNNYLDFGDLINYCLKLFKERPKILNRYREQFKYILVDEFQDTNWTQYELIKLLSAPKNNLTVSADDDQSLYSWRGSSFNNVLQFRKDYPGAEEIILTKNYRSPQNILDLSYKFIQLNNPNRLEYEISNVSKISENAKKKGVDLRNFKKINKKLLSTRKELGAIENLHFEDLEKETMGVVEKIVEILKKNKSARFSDFAILVRANNYAKPFFQEMERTGVPYQFLSSKGLYSKPIILDIIAYLKLLDNCYDNMAAFRALNSLGLKISHEDIAKITQYSHRRGQSIYETLSQLSLISGINQSTVNKISSFLSLIKKYTALSQKKNISEVFISFLNNSGYLKELSNEKKPDDALRNFNFINQFYDKIKKFEEFQNNPILNNFIKQIDLELEAGDEGSMEPNIEEGHNAVNVMTVHSAKGLEFQYVFLVNLVDKRFPSIEKKEPIELPEELIKKIILKGDAHLEEERRLFYVGMTRAKNGLFFCWADDYGGKRRKKQSRFLQECGISKEKEIQHLKYQGKVVLNKGNIANVRLKQVEKYPIPPYFSYTQLSTFQRCPLQYKFAYILKIPRPGKAVFTFGKTMHETLCEFVKKTQIKQSDLFNFKNKPSANKCLMEFKDLLKIYKMKWVDEWYENEAEKTKFYKQGEKSLKIFYKDFLNKNPKIKFIGREPALEKKFNLKINGYSLIGAIDRIDEIKGNSVEIIDYKTGHPKEKLKIDDKEQLLIYQIATEEIFKLNPKKMAYYYLENGTTLSFLGTEKEKKEMREKIIEHIHRIKENNFLPNPGWHCQFCDFKDICEFKQH
ncbi:MAG: ATP-dependent DNA helicase [Patescibacteria group bacterium]|nr:ATP-dependent DNA helicase [Patescibacteria group bacterium]